MPLQSMTSVDLLVMPHGFITDLSHRDLYRDDWVCVVSADNAEVGDDLTVEHLRTPWVVCSTGRPHRPLRRGRCGCWASNQGAVVIENFLTVPGLVAGSGRLRCCSADWRPASRREPASGSALSVRGRPLVEAIWWHPVYDDDPEHGYLRDVVVRAAAT